MATTVTPAPIPSPGETISAHDEFTHRNLILAAMCLSLVMVVAGRLHARDRAPEPGGRPRCEPVFAAVDRRRLRIDAGGAAAPRRRAGRPLRATGRADRGHPPVRHRVGARGNGRLAVEPDRVPGGDGHRCGAADAGHAVDDHERVPARGARTSGRHLGGFRRRRRHPRHRRVRRVARAVLLGVDLPRRGRARRGRAHCRHPRRARDQVDGTCWPRPGRRGAVGTRDRPPRARHHRRP